MFPMGKEHSRLLKYRELLRNREIITVEEKGRKKSDGFLRVIFYQTLKKMRHN